MHATSVTIAICTRNRGDDAAVAVRSALRNQPGCARRVLVVDQSDDEVTARALTEFQQDPRFDYVRTATVGLSRARNLALLSCESEWVLFTDDDCEVPENWVEEFVAALELDPAVAIGFCVVRPGPYDPSAGFIPTFLCQGTRVLRRIEDLTPERGIGAGLAVRRAPLLDLGGFDEQLGAGGAFPAGEDCDVAVRALLAGHAVCETDRTFVVHHGFRTWTEGRALTQRNWLGMGAAYMKPLRARHWRFAGVWLREFAVNAAWPPLRDLMHGRKPQGLGRIGYFALGAARALGTPFDAAHVLFTAAPAPTERSLLAPAATEDDAPPVSGERTARAEGEVTRSAPRHSRVA